jgi:hypothetical protein
MTLIERIGILMATDDADQSERLQTMYENATEAERDVIDGALICLCGYSLQTLIDNPEVGDADAQ